MQEQCFKCIPLVSTHAIPVAYAAINLTPSFIRLTSDSKTLGKSSRSPSITARECLDYRAARPRQVSASTARSLVFTCLPPRQIPTSRCRWMSSPKAVDEQGLLTTRHRAQGVSANYRASDRDPLPTLPLPANSRTYRGENGTTKVTFCRPARSSLASPHAPTPETSLGPTPAQMVPGKQARAPYTTQLKPELRASSATLAQLPRNEINRQARL